MKLADLLKGVAVRELKAPPELEIEDICYDSRRAAPGTLFVAVRGASHSIFPLSQARAGP